MSTKQDQEREQGIQLPVSHTLIDHHICHGFWWINDPTSEFCYIIQYQLVHHTLTDGSAVVHLKAPRLELLPSGLGQLLQWLYRTLDISKFIRQSCVLWYVESWLCTNNETHVAVCISNNQHRGTWYTAVNVRYRCISFNCRKLQNNILSTDG